jgi:hypothetical protein
MSIMAIVIDPKNESQKLFSVPISTEKNFKDNWMPLIQKLDLQWLPLFETGIDIELVDLESVLDELSKLQDIAKSELSADKYVDITKRVDELTAGLKHVFQETNIKVFIG